MNKSQKLNTMLLRAKIKAKEALDRHKTAWHGQEPKVMEEPDERERGAIRTGQEARPEIKGLE